MGLWNGGLWTQCSANLVLSPLGVGGHRPVPTPVLVYFLCTFCKVYLWWKRWNVYHCTGIQWDTSVIGFHSKKTIAQGIYIFLLYTVVWYNLVYYCMPYLYLWYTSLYWPPSGEWSPKDILSVYEVQAKHTSQNMMWRGPKVFFPKWRANNKTVFGGSDMPVCFILYHLKALQFY